MFFYSLFFDFFDYLKFVIETFLLFILDLVWKIDLFPWNVSYVCQKRKGVYLGITHICIYVRPVDTCINIYRYFPMCIDT